MAYIPATRQQLAQAQFPCKNQQQSLHDCTQQVLSGCIFSIMLPEIVSARCTHPNYYIVSQKGVFLQDLYPHERLPKEVVKWSRRRDTYKYLIESRAGSGVTPSAVVADGSRTLFRRELQTLRPLSLDPLGIAVIYEMRLSIWQKSCCPNNIQSSNLIFINHPA